MLPSELTGDIAALGRASILILPRSEAILEAFPAGTCVDNSSGNMS